LRHRSFPILGFPTHSENGPFKQRFAGNLHRYICPANSGKMYFGWSRLHDSCAALKGVPATAKRRIAQPTFFEKPNQKPNHVWNKAAAHTSRAANLVRYRFLF
jgi:hypothetical protein